MNKPQGLDAENLVEVYKAQDEWERGLIVGWLEQSGIKAATQGDTSMPMDMGHMFKSTEKSLGVNVLQHDAARARELIRDFVSAATDPALLEEAAAHRLRVDRETIRRLRGALKEERKTFEFLGWAGVVFLGAAAVLWMIWPAWLRMEAPSPVLRLAMIILLALGAVFAGNWAGRKV